MSGGVLRNPAITGTSKPLSKRTFGLGEEGRAALEPVSAIGFSRRGASSSGDFAPRRQFGGVRVHGKEVIRFELRIIGQDLLLGCPTGEPLQNLLNGDPVTVNARLPEPHVRIDRDPLKE